LNECALRRVAGGYATTRFNFTGKHLYTIAGALLSSAVRAELFAADAHPAIDSHHVARRFEFIQSRKGAENLSVFKKIAVLGAGAIGSSVAADIAKAGHDLTVIDQWPAHIEAIKANGLQVKIPDEEIHVAVTALHLCDVCTLNQQFDLVLLSAKSYDSAWMTQFIAPYLSADGVLVPVQNSLNDEWVAPIIGRARDVACAFELSAEVFTPGIVQRNTMRDRTWFGIGELDGQITPRLTDIQKILSCAGKVTITPNIHGAKWAKLVNSSMILAPFGMLGLQSWEATEIPEVFSLCVKLGRETMAVGAALGITIEPIFGMSAEEFNVSTDAIVEKLLRAILIHHGETARQVRGVVLQDYVKGRMTETDYINGLIARKGRAAGVPTPANDAVVEINRRIRAGQLKPERSNIAVAHKLAGA
jgi:2-dehydropantoate 2-reductase